MIEGEQEYKDCYWDMRFTISFQNMFKGSGNMFTFELLKNINQYIYPAVPSEQILIISYHYLWIK